MSDASSGIVPDAVSCVVHFPSHVATTLPVEEAHREDNAWQVHMHTNSEMDKPPHIDPTLHTLVTPPFVDNVLMTSSPTMSESALGSSSSSKASAVTTAATSAVSSASRTPSSTSRSSSRSPRIKANVGVFPDAPPPSFAVPSAHALSSLLDLQSSAAEDQLFIDSKPAMLANMAPISRTSSIRAHRDSKDDVTKKEWNVELFGSPPPVIESPPSSSDADNTAAAVQALESDSTTFDMPTTTTSSSTVPAITIDDYQDETSTAAPTRAPSLTVSHPGDDASSSSALPAIPHSHSDLSSASKAEVDAALPPLQSSASDPLASSSWRDYDEVPLPPPPAARFPFWVGSWNMGAKEMSSPPISPAYPTQQQQQQTAGSSSNGPPSPFAAWIPGGYRMYVIGLQESISEKTYRALDAFLSSPPYDCVRLTIPASNSQNDSDSTTLSGTVKIQGRGDGSFLFPKSTSIAVWVNRGARSLVTYCAHGALSLGMTQGSKGGAALALKIIDTTIVFVSCHLSSTTLTSRRGSYTSLIESVGNALGDRYFQLLEQFHHCFFFGDLNFRLNDTINAAEAVMFMQRQDLKGLLAYDELSAELKHGHGAFASFQEPPIDFWPTYKKHEKRTIPTPAKIGLNWVHDVYKTIYTLPFYKSGKVAQRVPSWCDRILRHSLSDQKDRITVLQYHPLEYDETLLDPVSLAHVLPPATAAVVAAEVAAAAPAVPANKKGARGVVKPPLAVAPPARIGGAGNINTYRALEDALSSSDHSPVSCGFQLTLPHCVNYAVTPTSLLVASAANGGANSSSSNILSPTIPSASLGATKASSSRALLTVSPPARSSSSSVSSPSQQALQSTSPIVYIVRLITVRVLQTTEVSTQNISPVIRPSVSELVSPLNASPGVEPKYVRVLFPAPFEIAPNTPFASKQISFSSSSSSSSSSSGQRLSPTAGAAAASPNHHLNDAASSPAASAQLDARTDVNEGLRHMKAEFRCLTFETVPHSGASSASSSSPSGSSSLGLQLPPSAPFHFLLKVHSADDVSGQCCVSLPREAFETKCILEFCEFMTRDGIPLVHPLTKQRMQVHFTVQLDAAKVATKNPPQPILKAMSSKNI